ncbi:MAG TPA: hypothetical protein VFC19_03805 [Candidatus Limnocylindrales bacterium]|nr:hypothetical protein [Candidatus Limnocylindrales bacterium]
MADADRSARTPQEAAARLRTGVSVAQQPPGHDYVGGLGWFKVWRRGQRLGPPPAGLSADALARRRFAERLADTFAYPDVYVASYGHGGDLVGASSAFVPVEVSPLAQRVIADAEKVTEQVMATPGETRVYYPGDGVVVLVHGPDWSLVFVYSSVDVVIRVCGDEWGDTALAVDEDPDRAVQSRLLTMVYDVLFQLQRLSVGGDLFTKADGSEGR